MDKIVLITGASSGIGEGCARKFASNGAKLILNSRSIDKLNTLAQELKEKYGTESYVLPFDVRDRKAALEALDSMPEEWKAIDILVNNAGCGVSIVDTVEQTKENIDMSLKKVIYYLKR